MRCSRDSFLAGSFSKKFSGGRHMLQLQRQDIPDHRHCAPGCCIPRAAQLARIKPIIRSDNPSQSCCAVGDSGTTAEPDLITWTELEAAVAAVLLPPDWLPLLPCSLACGVGPELCLCDGPGVVAISFLASSQRPEMTSGSSLGLDINPRAGACRRREEGRRSVLIRRSGSLPRPRRTGAAGHTAALTTGWSFQRPAAAGL